MNASLKRLGEYDVYIEIDFSRFDQSQNESVLQHIQNRIFAHMFPGDDKLAEALRLSMCIKGISNLGVKYEAIGRGSGDAHTSIGNGLINLFCTWVCLRKLPRSSWTSFHEGDDGIIGMKAPFVKQACHNFDFLQALGFSLKIATSNDMPDICFVGRRFFMRNDGEIASAPDLKRLLRKFHVSASPIDSEAIVVAKSFSLFLKYPETPIVSMLTKKIVSLCAKNVQTRKFVRALRHVDPTSWRKSNYDYSDFASVKNLPKLLNDKMVWAPIDVEKRVIANLCDGVNYRQQILFETMVNSWKFIPDRIVDFIRFEEKYARENVSINGQPYNFG